MAWVVTKRTHGWWYAEYYPSAQGMSEKRARALTAERNRERRRSKPWLTEHVGPELARRVHHTSQKYCVNGQVLLDDCVEHVVAWGRGARRSWRSGPPLARALQRGVCRGPGTELGRGRDVPQHEEDEIAERMDRTMNREHLDKIRRIVTHAVCPDGLASAMILKAALPQLEVAFCTYEQLPTLDPTVPTLYCDIAPHGERDRDTRQLTDRGLVQIAAHADAGSIVLDHHPTAEDVVHLFATVGRGRYADKARDPGVSGALLAYEEVYVPVRGRDEIYGQVRSFAELAGVRDTWQTASPRWEDACAQAEALMFYTDARLVGRAWPHLTEGEMGVGRILRATKREQAEKTARGLFHATQPPYRIGLFNDAAHGFRWTSDVAEAVRKLEIGLDLVVGYYYRVEPDGELRLHYSMRSITPSTDVQSIGQMYDGGGHRLAAGFSLPTGIRIGTPGAPPTLPQRAMGSLDPVSAFTWCVARWHAQGDR